MSRGTDEPMPDPKEQQNKAFRIQAFVALRYGFERGRRREAAARAHEEKSRNGPC
jgi:hypothetical protein